MRRFLVPAFFVVVIAVGVVGAFLLERSGVTQQAIPDIGGPAEDEPGLTAPPSLPPATGDDQPTTEATRTEGDEPEGGPVIATTVEAPEGQRLYWGAYRPSAPYEEQAVDALIEVSGATPAILMWYQPWAGEPLFPTEAAERLLQAGIVPMVTWESWEPPVREPGLDPADARSAADQPMYRLDRIVDGAFDDYIRAYARSIRSFGGPVMLRIFHEMDGFWYPWGGTVNENEPEDVVRAWRHVHDLFAEVGATNVTWVWSVNHESVPRTEANSIANYWPGDEYVDWAAVDGFNFGTTSDVATWQAFEEVYEDRFEELERYDHPIAITEIASVEEGGDKAAWIADAFERIIERHESVGALIWYDREVRDARDFRIASSESSREAIRDAIERPPVLTSPAALRTVEYVPLEASAG